MERETRLGLIRSHLTAISCFASMTNRHFAKTLQPQLAHATRFVARYHAIFTQYKKGLEYIQPFFISGRRGSNSRHPPWQGGILPLNYPRSVCYYHTCSKYIVKQFSLILSYLLFILNYNTLIYII